MKSQAETAGRLGSSSLRPHKGMVLRDVELWLADGSHNLLSMIRGHSNLLMIFTGSRDLGGLVGGLTSVHDTLVDYSARVLVISLGSGSGAGFSEMNLRQVVFSPDPTGTIHRALGAIDARQTPVPALYITDRFGEVFAAFRANDPVELPSPREIMGWLEFINYQCEECSPPEWPE